MVRFPNRTYSSKKGEKYNIFLKLNDPKFTVVRVTQFFHYVSGIINRTLYCIFKKETVFPYG